MTLEEQKKLQETRLILGKRWMGQENFTWSAGRLLHLLKNGDALELKGLKVFNKALLDKWLWMFA